MRKKIGVPSALSVLASLVSAASPAAESSRAIEEITVTATRRSVGLQDVPVAITAIGSEQMEKRGLQQFSDYLPSIPGVSLQDRGAGRNKIVIRGISSGPDPAETPTVATYFGESLVSVLPTTQASSPNIKLFDVERVEVLRGPQGTLFGAGSMGGTVRIIPAAPALDAFGMSAEAGVSGTAHSEDLGSDLGAAVNLPIVPGKFAVRVAAYHQQDAGFSDNVSAAVPEYDVPDVSRRDVNDVEISGARVSALWQVSDNLRVSAVAFLQETKSGGLPDANPLTVGEYGQSRYLRERLGDEINLFSLDVAYASAIGDFVSSTSYLQRDTTQIRDTYGIFGIPVGLYDSQTGDFFSQELRWSSSGAGPWSWLGGLYFSREQGHFRQGAHFSGTTLDAERRLQADMGIPSDPGSAPMPWYDWLARPETEQVAAFGEVALTAGLWTVTAGARVMEYEQKRVEDNRESVLGGPDSFDATERTESVFTPKLNIEYQYSDEVRYYGQAAKGFRLGAVLSTLPDLCNQDLIDLGLGLNRDGAESDSVWSYELGAKTRLADRRVTLNAAAFVIDWKDVQTNVLLPACGFQVTSNGGKASSKGLEVELSALLAQRFTVDFSASYVRAQLEQDTSAESGLNGLSGDRLPGIPRYNVHGGLGYDFLLGQADAYLRADATYVGGYYGSFNNLHDRVGEVGDYTLVDFRFGAQFGQWSAEAFLDNAFDERVVFLNDPEFPDGRQSIGRPRTYGVVVRYRL